MNSSELLHILALMRIEGVGDIVAKRLIHHCGSAEAVFRAKKSQLKAIDGIGAVLLNNLKDTSVFTKAEHELAYIEREGIRVLYYQDAAYPERLKHCVDGPTLLFASGAIDFSNRRVISIVGTRQITSYGIDFCKKLVEDLACFNPLIVSGFAFGVDIVAHQASMDHGLQTIGVLAHGMNQLYPKSHQKYVSKMEQNGGFLTEFWSTSNPDKENFVKRNRIVAGISEATIVVESAEKGGSLITATMANDYNRDVFAVPGRVTDRYSIGCNDLIKTQRAQLMTSAADLVYHLNWDLTDKAVPSIQKQLFVTLEAEEQLIYDYLQKQGKQLLDVIALSCNLPIFKTSSLLITMELKGLIRPLPGKLFEVI
jgi:DNA processing protein